MYLRALPSYLLHCHYDWLNNTMWSNGKCCIPCGMVAAILFQVDQVMCEWLNHTMWFHSNRALPRSMEFQSMLIHFFTQYRANMLCRLFDDRKYMDIWYISLYLRNTAILENKKIVCIFSHQLVNTCDLHIHTS